MRSAVAILALVVVAGCNLAPRHVRPAAPTPQAYPAAYADDSISGALASEIGWRDFIVDPRLESLVGTALERNRDLAVAVAQIEEARGLYRIQNADRLPTVAATGTA
ncbi:MAG TPA: TolC family protein, partial [Gemmatimonadaceae bacterium]|nr:TolC family protein [Gemmatimonadaceae bacterium]